MVFGVEEYEVAFFGDGSDAGGVGEGAVSVGNPCDGGLGDSVEDCGVAVGGAGGAKETEFEDVARGDYGVRIFEECGGREGICF